MLIESFEDYPINEPIFILIIVGVIFSFIAFIMTIKAKPFPSVTKLKKNALTLIIICFVIIFGYLTIGSDEINIKILGVVDEESFATEFSTLIQKLIVFVFIPLILFKTFSQNSFKDLGFVFRGTGKLWKSHLPVLAGMVTILILFQYFAGNGAEPIRSGQFTTTQLLFGIPIVFLWLMIEVGLVEEFFFRSILQTRLSIIFDSEWGGIVLTSLLFGLAHAPGLFLRGAGDITPIGDSPSLLLSIGYSILVLSVPGFFLGIIWARTKNLFLLIIIHAATNLLASYPKLMGIFNLI